MKKTIRNAFAMLLALVIACGGVTAFAQTPGDIEWYFGDDEPWIYSYAGTLEVGEETVLPPVSEEKSVYLTVDIEESGYYKITVDSDIWYGIPDDCADGKYEDTMDSIAYMDSACPRYYYLEAGETIVGFDLYGDRGVTVKAEYVGDITAIEFDRSILENIILGYGIVEWDDGTYEIEAENVTIKFSLGEEYVYEWTTITIHTENGLVKGENDVEIGFWGTEYREKAVVSVIEITDIIESVEVTNLKNYAVVTTYYDGSVYAPAFGFETLTVTYTDGTTEIIEDFGGYAELENCQYNVRIDYEEMGGEWFVYVRIAGQNMQQEKCSVERATLSENLKEYKDYCFESIHDIVYSFDSYVESVFNINTFDDAFFVIFYMSRYLILEVVSVFGGVFKETLLLFGSLI